MDVEHIDSGGQASESHEEESAVEEALLHAGLVDVEAPRRGTVAYDRLVEAAEHFIVEVKKMHTPRSQMPLGDSENFFRPKKIPVSSSDSVRRKYHDELCMMLLGKLRKDLSSKEAAQVSNFAAYLTGHTEYIDTW